MADVQLAQLRHEQDVLQTLTLLVSTEGVEAKVPLPGAKGGKTLSYKRLYKVLTDTSALTGVDKGSYSSMIKRDVDKLVSRGLVRKQDDTLWLGDGTPANP